MADHFTDTATSTRYDAIVIGSGISGGWAAKELCERGLKTLVLERGRTVEHVKDYPTMNLERWEFPHRGQLTRKQQLENPILSRAAGYGEDTQHFFIQDKDQPYIQEKPFDWIRGYQVGGKSLIWGRASARWSPYDFSAPVRFGYGASFPFDYDQIKDWYSHVERFIGVCGFKDNIASMPDGEFLSGYELNEVEQHLQSVIKARFGRHYVSGRWAHLTEPQSIHLEQGRGTCQNRNKCMRGCPFGGYFSSNSSTLPWAERTGNLTIRPNSVVQSIVYDDRTQKARGVRVIDAVSREVLEFEARIIFVNASALNTNLILLNSRSDRFPNGLGNDNGMLGKFVGFHNYRGSMNGDIDGFEQSYYRVSKPAECIVANFRNLDRQETDFKGGYVIYSGAYRKKWNDSVSEDVIGSAYKDRISQPGGWGVYMYMQGETILKESNLVRLSPDRHDSYGMPLLITSVGYDSNDDRMVADFLQEGKRMLEAAGVKNIESRDSGQAPGLDIHEMGGVRMGKDSKNSLLNEWNQLHLCPNVLVTDGACMTSTGSQSPSILYMAMTARAVDHIHQEIKKGNL